MDWILVTLTLIVIACVVGVLWDRIVDWLPLDDETREAVLKRRYYRDAAARGLSFREALDELDLRTCLAELRREASARVVSSPMGGHDARYIVREIAQRQVLSLSAQSNAMAKRYLRWVESLSMADILYSDAMSAYNDHVRQVAASIKPASVPQERRLDRIAALTVRKR